MPKKLIGYRQCPECDADGAEVGEDKNGSPYTYCPQCNVQIFCRGDPVKEGNMKRKMKPIAPAPQAKPAPEKKPDPAPAPAARKPGVLDSFLAGGKKS